MADEPPEVVLVRTALARTGRATLRTRGDSMLPAIVPGTVVTLVARPYRSVVPGDVVAAVIGGRVIVHRVAEAGEAGLLTLGDNRPLLDPIVEPDRYLGVVSDHHRRMQPRRPDLRALGELPPPGEPGPTHVWIPGPLPADRPPGLAIRSAHDPGRLRSADGHGRCGSRVVIGVSPFGALPPAALDTVLRAAGPREVHLLLGYLYGDRRVAPAGQPTLGPDAADFHIRLGTPWSPPTLADVLGFVADRVRTLRAAVMTDVSAALAGGHRS